MEKEIASSTISKGGGGGKGRGRGSRGRGGGRGGGRTASGRGRGGGQRRPATAGSGSVGGGRGGNNNGRHPRQPAKSPNKPQGKKHQGGGGRGRPCSSSYNEKRDDYCNIKKSGPYVHLFCSERHAFALSRTLYPLGNDHFILPSNQSSNKNRIAADDELEQWWEAVKIVRCHVPFNESTGAHSSEAERCPICLDDEMVSPFISPCGHAFCLPCVLGYLNSVVKDLNDESDRTHKNKQNVKGNSGVVGAAALATRASITTVRARCPMCSSGSSMEISAGESMITYKDLRPVVFVPTVAMSAASVGESHSGKGKNSNELRANPPQRGTRMKFVKLHRVKDCPAPYLPVHGNRVRGANTLVTSENRVPDLPDGDDNAEECNYARQYFVGLKEYENILQRDLDDLNNYRENTVHCQLDSREDWNVSMATEAVQAAQRRWHGSNINTGGFQGMEFEAKLAAMSITDMDHMLLSATHAESKDGGANEEAKPRAKGQKSSALLQPGYAHLQQNSNNAQSSLAEANEFLCYQSSDGQPCFLSGINVACLMHEFSLHQPHIEGVDADLHHINDSAAIEKQDEDTNRENIPQYTKPQNKHPNEPRSTLPLPDELTGTVLQIEQLTVTNSLIKRKPFLSHIPLTSSVSFVEIDWYSGGDGGNKPMLSHATLSKFRGELQRRKSERLHTAKREQKADKVARTRSEKEEHRRRRELLGSNYLYEGSRQTIEPDDEFFQAPAASFDEPEEFAQRNRSSSFQFNQVCAEGGAWPDLSSPGNRGNQEPVATAPSSSPQTNATWASRDHSIVANAPAAKAAVNHFPSLSELSHLKPKPQSKGGNTMSSWGSR